MQFLGHCILDYSQQFLIAFPFRDHPYITSAHFWTFFDQPTQPTSLRDHPQSTSTHCSDLRTPQGSPIDTFYCTLPIINQFLIIKCFSTLTVHKDRIIGLCKGSKKSWLPILLKITYIASFNLYFH